jgi:hypothetical protein
MSTGRWSGLRAEHEVRYTGVERFLVFTMSKTSGMAEGFEWVGGWDFRSEDQTGVRVGIVPYELSPSVAKPRVPVHVFGVEISAIKIGKAPPKQAVRSAPISGREGERYAARTITGLPARVTRIAVASKWVRPVTGIEW